METYLERLKMDERVWVYQRYITEKELLIEKLQAENEKLKRTMRLHAGDCCSLANEVDSFRDRWEDAEERCDELEALLKKKEIERLKNGNKS